MLVQTVMSLAAPWPLKIVLDNVVGTHKLPAWLGHLLRPFLKGDGKMSIAIGAAIAAVVIAAVGRTASYVANYYTESVGQWVANDLRMRTYHHLQRLSLGYYDQQQTGASAEHDHGGRADHPGFRLFVHARHRGRSVHDPGHAVHHVLAELGFHSDRRGGHAVHAVAGIAIQEGSEESDSRSAQAANQHRSVVQQGLRVDASGQGVRTAGTGGRELGEVSRATVDAALKARRVKALLSPIVTVTVSMCTAVVLWRGSALILAGAMTAGALTVFLSYLTQVLQAGEGPGHHDQFDRAGGGGRRSRSRDPRCGRRDSGASRRAQNRTRVRGAIRFDQVSSPTTPKSPVLQGGQFQDRSRGRWSAWSVPPAGASPRS